MMKQALLNSDYIIVELENVLILNNYLCIADFKWQIENKKIDEIIAWKNNICWREVMLISIREAIDSGKKVYFISDIAYGRQVVETILKSVNIVNYEALLLTSETDMSKEMLMKELVAKIHSGKITVYASAISPFLSHNQVTMFKVKTPLEALQDSAYKEILTYCKTANDRMILARFINRIFNNPFVLQERAEIDKAYDLGYLFVAPMVTGFMLWLFDYAAKSNCTKILFSARDGYLIQKLYDLGLDKLGVSNMPESIYFQVSRTLCVSANVYGEEDIINYAGVKYRQEPEKMLERRFGLCEEEIKAYSKEKYKSEVDYALEHKCEILKNSKRIRENYLKYINNLGLNSEEEYILFDFVSSGTCQYLLDRFSKLKMHGAYFCRYYPFEGITNYTDVEAKAKLPIDAYVVNKSTKEKETYLFQNYNFLETIFTSLQPSVYTVDKMGIPILDEERRTEEQLEYVREVQQAITDFYLDFLEYAYVPNEPLSFSFLDKMLNFKSIKYTDECCEVLNDFYLIEDFGQGKILLHRK